MARFLVACLTASLVLGACAVAPTGKSVPRRTGATVRPTPKPAPTAVVPSTAPTPRPSPSLPAGPSVLLTGTVTIDAHYVISNAAGSVVSNNGAGAIALAGADLLSDNGASLISNNGGSLIANNSGTYRLLAGPTVPIGTLLPAQGMVVAAVALRTGRLVAGPVLSDASGTYRLAVPEEVQGTLQVVAMAPGRSESDPARQDPRLRYGRLVSTVSAQSPLDEDTSVVARYLRTAYTKRVADALVATDIDGIVGSLLATLRVPVLARPLVKGTFESLNQISFQAGLPAKEQAVIEAAAQRAADALLSFVDVETLEIDPAAVRKDSQGDRELAMPALTDVLRRLREGAAARMQADPTFFEQKDYIRNARKPTEIKRPTDFSDFFIDEILLGNEPDDVLAERLFADVGLPREQVLRAHTVSVGIGMAIGQTLMTNSEAKAAMEQAIRDAAR